MPCAAVLCRRRTDPLRAAVADLQNARLIVQPQTRPSKHSLAKKMPRSFAHRSFIAPFESRLLSSPFAYRTARQATTTVEALVTLVFASGSGGFQHVASHRLDENPARGGRLMRAIDELEYQFRNFARANLFEHDIRHATVDHLARNSSDAVSDRHIRE